MNGEMNYLGSSIEATGFNRIIFLLVLLTRVQGTFGLMPVAEEVMSHAICIKLVLMILGSTEYYPCHPQR